MQLPGLYPRSSVRHYEVQADELHGTSRLQEDLAADRIVLHVHLCSGGRVDLDLESVKALLLLYLGKNRSHSSTESS